MKIRTEAEIRKARKVIVNHLANPKISEEQRTLLNGISVALQWVCNQDGHVLQQLIDGRPIETD